jgi:hypothetical protein
MKISEANPFQENFLHSVNKELENLAMIYMSRMSSWNTYTFLLVYNKNYTMITEFL